MFGCQLIKVRMQDLISWNNIKQNGMTESNIKVPYKWIWCNHMLNTNSHNITTGGAHVPTAILRLSS